MLGERSFTGAPDGDKRRGLPSVGPVRSSPSVMSPRSSAVNCLIAPGLPAVKRWLLESILVCIDLTELPPAKGRSKVMPNSLEGKVLLLHETDFQQSSSQTSTPGSSVFPCTQRLWYTTTPSAQRQCSCTWPQWGN